MSFKFLFFFLLFFVLFAFFGFVNLSSDKASSNFASKEPAYFFLKYPSSGGSGYLFLRSFSGQKVFDALVDNNVSFTYKDFGFGKMVVSIMGVEPKHGEYLAIYVDRVYAEKGVSELEVRDKMLLEFRIEKIN